MNLQKHVDLDILSFDLLQLQEYDTYRTTSSNRSALEKKPARKLKQLGGVCGRRSKILVGSAHSGAKNQITSPRSPHKLNPLPR